MGLSLCAKMSLLKPCGWCGAIDAASMYVGGASVIRAINLSSGIIITKWGYPYLGPTSGDGGECG